MKKKNYKKYELIFNEGTYGNSAYMIDFGKVGIISNTNQNGQRKLLATLKKDDIFGEMGLIDNKVRAATAFALEDTQVSVISKKTFDYLNHTLSLHNNIVDKGRCNNVPLRRIALDWMMIYNDMKCFR